MNKKNFITLCSVIGLIGGLAFGVYITEPEKKEMSAETKASLYAAMESEENAGIFVDDIPATPEFESFTNYSDYNELCSQHYGAVTTVVTKEDSGAVVLVLIGPQAEVDFIRMKVNIGARVHYCPELEY